MMSVFKQKRASYVYVIECGQNKTKVGVSNDPGSRLLALQTANPSRISIYFTLPCISSRLAYKIENRAHAILVDRRLTGEWFSCSASEAVLAVAEAALTVAADDFGFVTVRDEDVGISRRATRILAETCRASGLRKGEIISEAIEQYYSAELTSPKVIRLPKRIATDAEAARLRSVGQMIVDASGKPISWSALVRKAGISKVDNAELVHVLDHLEKSGAIIVRRSGRGVVIQSSQSDKVAA